MNIKDFVKDALIEIDQAVNEAGSVTNREVWLSTGAVGHRTVEFDIAVTVEESKASKGKAGIKVLELLEGGGELSKNESNATVSRIKFGVDFASSTKVQQEVIDSFVDTHNYESILDKKF